MTFLEQLDRLIRIERLIELKATGSPCQFAKKIGISESTLYEDLKILKEIGIQIEYSRISQTYYLKESNNCRKCHINNIIYKFKNNG